MTSVPSTLLEFGRGHSGVPLARTPDGLGWCVVDIYLDGQFVPWARDVGFDNIIARNDIRGIEVYPRESQIPAEVVARFAARIKNNGELSGGAVGSGTADCGVILMWTKQFDLPKTWRY